MLYGTGSTVMLAKDLDALALRGEKALFPQCLASFELSTDTTFGEAKCMRKGIMLTTASAITAETFSLNLTYQFNDWTNLQLLFGEIATTEASVSLPVAKAAEVPAGLVITDADITAQTAPSVCVTDITNSELLLVDVGNPGTAAPGTVAVNEAGNLTFDAAQAGITVEYVVDKTYTSIEAIGVADDVDFLTNLTFTGLIASTPDGEEGYQIVIERLERISTPTITLAGDVAEISIEYRCIVPPGKRKPFQLYRLSTATV